MVGSLILKRKTPANNSGRNIAVSGENLVASIPPVRIRDGIGVHVPVAVVAVPVRVHRPDISCHKPSTPPPIGYQRQTLG